MKLIAIIPAKKHSNRLPNKNFKFFFGKPIIYWVLEEIHKSEIFDKVIVSADCSENFQWCDAEYYNRPEHLCSDTATVDEVCLDVLEKYTGYDYMCCVYPTSYALTWQDLCKSFQQMLKEEFTNEACCSFGMLNGEYFMDNGGFYWCKIERFLENNILMKMGHSGYELPIVDINTIEDFAQAKLHALTLGDRFK